MDRRKRSFVFRFFRFVVKIKLIFNRKEYKVFRKEREVKMTEIYHEFILVSFSARLIPIRGFV